MGDGVAPRLAPPGDERAAAVADANRFPLLFVSLVVLLLLHPLLSRGPFAAAAGQALFALILVSAVRAVAVSASQMRIGLVAVAASLIPGIVSVFRPDQLLIAAARITALALLAWVCWLVTAAVLRARRVTADMLYGAACSYLLLGVLFALVYALLDAATPGVAQLPAASGSPLGGASLGETIYFSFVTLTTLGYGDISPSGPLARSVAPVEALAGQLYLAVLIARLVGLHIAQATTGPGK